MTHQPAAAAMEALHSLLDLIRERSLASDALPTALAWLVMGRLALRGKAPALGTGFDNGPQHLRNTLLNVDAPPQLQDSLIKALAEWHEPLTGTATYIVRRLLDSPQATQWGLQDAAWLVGSRSRTSSDSLSGAFDPAVCDVAVASLRVTKGDHVWVPFDASGQFTTRLVAQGARVWRAGPGYDDTGLTSLLLALGDDADAFERVSFAEAPPPTEGAWEVNKCLVAAPVNMKITGPHAWREWQIRSGRGRALWVDPEELDRSDAWAVAAMWPRVKQRGVFLTSPSLLFAHGQEERLRKALLLDRAGNMVEAVGALPQGSMGGVSISPALLVLDTTAHKDRVRLANLAGLAPQDGSKVKLGRDLAPLAAVSLLQAVLQQPSFAVDVDLKDIEECDFSLVPQRYINRIDDLGGERCALGDLIEQVVRSPVPSKDLNGWAVWEIGIPRLEQWRPIDSGYERFMKIAPRKANEALLREGDLVVAIKGTVGKVGIVGRIPASYEQAKAAQATIIGEVPTSHSEAPQSASAVAAASCVGLRVDRSKVLPEYLLLYLRSHDFKRQLEALRVGSTIAHITPATLLSGVQVLLMPIREQQKLCDRYQSLCSMEAQIEDLDRQMRETHRSLFPSAHQL